MTARACPDWPELMERAPDLHFKHHTPAEVELPGEALVRLAGVPSDAILCCDRERHVFHARHTDPRVVAALEGTHWLELEEWTSLRPGAAA